MCQLKNICELESSRSPKHLERICQWSHQFGSGKILTGKTLQVSPKSEHSDSKFCYPGKMSDTELHQLSTYSESSLLINEEPKWSNDKMLID